MTQKDVIVTIPKSRGGCSYLKEKVAASKKEDWDVWWEFSRLPKFIDDGSKLYIVCEGFIRGYFSVKRVEPEPIQGKYHSFDYYQVFLKGWIPFEESVPMKGFQGFRYVGDEHLWRLK